MFFVLIFTQDGSIDYRLGFQCVTALLRLTEARLKDPRYRQNKKFHEFLYLFDSFFHFFTKMANTGSSRWFGKCVIIKVHLSTWSTWYTTWGGPTPTNSWTCWGCLTDPESTINFGLYHQRCRLGLTLWNLSCLEFKFDDTRISYWHKNKIGRIEIFFVASWLC